MPPSTPESDRIPRLADRLAVARRGRFVGRSAELDRFRAALLADEPPFAVLHVFGPGGVGKSALLREYGCLAAESGRSVVSLDARNVEPTPPGLLAALGLALGLQEADRATFPAAWPSDCVVLIDTYEHLATIDSWLRDELLPQLPARSLVVLAGRNPPVASWRTDLDWADLTQIVPLLNLRPEESQTYLTVRGIPAEQHAELLTFTHGHPLALSLVADALNRGDRLTAFDPMDEPEVVRVLLERLVHQVPSARHRLALEICVLAKVTTEALIVDLLGGEDAHEIFAWLRQLSFIEQSARGLFPHDLAREVLEADARWRDVDATRRLGRRISQHVRAGLVSATPMERQRLQLEAHYALRTSPTNRAYFDWTATENVYAAPATAEDADAIEAMVRRHQGNEAARIARYWLRRQPESFLVFHTFEGVRFGFNALLAIQNATDEDIAADPAIAPVLSYVQWHNPPRPGEVVQLLRFWMHQDAYQAVTAAINLTAANAVTSWTTTPNLAWTVTSMADPDFWVPHFAGINFWRSPQADYEVGGHRYGAFAHDWRVEPASIWPSPDHARPSFSPPPQPVTAACLPTSSQEAFSEAVRQALRDYVRPDRLATNPLTGARVVTTTAVNDDVPAAIRALLRAAVGAMANPKEAKFHRALWHTYFEPAPTQEQAAELLDLPFNTYRYRLAKGTERLTDWLWQREQNAANV